jgi:hypothetical protein
LYWNTSARYTYFSSEDFSHHAGGRARPYVSWARLGKLELDCRLKPTLLTYCREVLNA